MATIQEQRLMVHVRCALRKAFLPLAIALLLNGCREAEVEPPQSSVETTITIGEPPYLLPSGKKLEPKKKADDIKPPEAEAKTESEKNTGTATQSAEFKDPDVPWQRDLQITFDQRPSDDNELLAQIADRRPVVADAARKLLQEIQDAVQKQRVPSDTWSIGSMMVTRARRPADILLTAEVVVSKLYARRPTIAFNGVLLSLCVGKLAREAGMLYAQPRGHNPLITWSGTNVTAVEAVEQILQPHNYTAHFVNIKRKVALRLEDRPPEKSSKDAGDADESKQEKKEKKGKGSKDVKEITEAASHFATRAAFVEAAAKAIIEAGNTLNKTRPAITVTLVERAPGEKIPAPKPDVKSAAKSEPKPEPKPASKEDNTPAPPPAPPKERPD